MQRRSFAIALGASSFVASPAQALDWAALRPGDALLLRHARAPGAGDPAGFQLGDCRTQRNLDAEGRDQSRRLGNALRQALVPRGLPVAAVWASPWCRTVETAWLAFPQDAVEVRPAWASFFSDPQREDPQTLAAQAELAAFSAQARKGVLVVVTHQVNITALTGIVPSSGEGVWVRGQGGAPRVLGRWLAG